MDGNGAASNAELRDLLDSLLEPVEELKTAFAVAERAPVTASATHARGEDITATIAIPAGDAKHGGQAKALVSTLDRCPACEGTGSVSGDGRCTACGGSGRVERQHVLNVRFPAGIASGDRLRVAAEGNASAGDGDRGDLFLSVMLVPTPRKRLRTIFRD